ncbi:hypothetical protein N9X61_02240 [Sulfurimonas sp.]|nr:hypothetical protein [Sulfurimonas sp.]
MFNKFYEFLYVKVLVNIIIGHTKTVVYIEILNKSGVVNSHEEKFDTKYLSSEMYEYITTYTKETPYFYVSILDNSVSQGAIPTCSKHKTGYFQDLSASEYKCYKDKWVYYTAKTDVYAIEKVYEKIGVDFIFSPFILLANFFKDKIDTHLAMFILVEEGSLALSIFDNSQLLYAEYLDMEIEIAKDELMMDDNTIEDIDLDESIDLDDIASLDDIDELDDDFGDIADLDSIDELDDFDETKDVEEELAESEDVEDFPIQDSDGLNEDYQRFALIQSAVNNFYKDEKFASEFIENVYIGDGVGVSADLKKYLEEEMFLNVYVRHVDLTHELSEIVKMELS